MSLVIRRFFTVAVAIVVTGFAASSVAVASGSASQFGHNLVVNGDAEANVGAASADQVVKPSGWTTTGEFTAVQYGISGGFPDDTSPGPSNRGKNDFEGGNAPKSTATQTISLSSSAPVIAGGGVHYLFSAWLGGFSTQDGDATASVTFENGAGASLGSASLGPVSAAQRNGVTGLLQRSHSGVVPKGTTKAVVTIVMTRYEGEYNDGSADNISLVLTKS